MDRADESFEQSLDSLRGHYGGSFESNIQAAVNLAGEIDREVPGFSDWLNRTQIGNDPYFIRAFAALAKRAARPVEKSQGPNRDEFGRPMLDFPSMR